MVARVTCAFCGKQKDSTELYKCARCGWVCSLCRKAPGVFGSGPSKCPRCSESLDPPVRR